nr:MAG TPA: hypothetical protein [Caudoviricetes sp.]
MVWQSLCRCCHHFLKVWLSLYQLNSLCYQPKHHLSCQDL